MLVVDIGANIGDLGKDLVRKDFELKYLAVEPNHLICGPALDQLQQNYPESITYRIAAVADRDGEGILYSPRSLNGQVGSLLRINESGDWQDSVKSRFNPPTFQDSIQVETISVPTLLGEHNISRIDFLKIDTQGTDLQILGDFLANCEVRVAVVEIEVTSNPENSHYLQSKNSMSSFFKLINKYGFEVVRLMPASGDCTEFNVFIAKSYSDYASVNKELDFQSLRIFSRFWTVLGIGKQNSSLEKSNHLSLFRKLLSSLKHPMSSYRSLVIKLTS